MDAGPAPRALAVGLTVMAPAPPQIMNGADTMTVSLTPALSQREREMWSALRATFTVNADLQEPLGLHHAIVEDLTDSDEAR